MVVTVHDAEKIEVVVLDNGAMRQAVDDLLADTSLGEHVFRAEAEARWGGPTTCQYQPGALPIAAWSTGEKSLWLFLASLNGHQPINLYGLAAQFKGTPEALHISKIIRLLFIERD